MTSTPSNKNIGVFSPQNYRSHHRSTNFSGYFLCPLYSQQERRFGPLEFGRWEIRHARIDSIP